MTLKTHAAAAFFAIAFAAPAAWMLLDRDPPHIRESGQILADAPADCGLDDDAPKGGIYPGSCVAVEWKIKTLRTCQRSSTNSTMRRITDAQNVRWPIGPVETVLGGTHPRRDLVRNFILPSGVAVGPASYHAISCFTCNPLHYLWPVCVDKPDIPFEVARP